MAGRNSLEVAIGVRISAGEYMIEKKITHITEKEWKIAHKKYGESLPDVNVPDGTKPYEEWELKIIAEENNRVVQRSLSYDRFIQTILMLKEELNNALTDGNFGCYRFLP